MNLKQALRVLGLIQIDDLDEVKKVYRKLALKEGRLPRIAKTDDEKVAEAIRNWND